MSSLSYSGRVSMTIIWFNGRSLPNNWNSILISSLLNIIIFYRVYYFNISYNPMVAGYFSRGSNSGATHFFVELGLRWGIALFIVSEVFFFVRFFWAFFHRRLSPNIEVGSLWPPFGVKVFNPFQVP